MTRTSSRRVRALIGDSVRGVFLTIIIGWSAGHTDEYSEPLAGIYIENAVITPAGAGETAIIGFRLDNFSGRNIRLIGVNSQISDSAVIVMRSGSAGLNTADGVVVMEEETLDLRTSHMWIELQGLRMSIQDGDLVPFELVFSTGTVPAEAHAHVGAMPGAQ